MPLAHLVHERHHERSSRSATVPSRNGCCCARCCCQHGTARRCAFRMHGGLAADSLDAGASTCRGAVRGAQRQPHPVGEARRDCDLSRRHFAMPHLHLALAVAATGDRAAALRHARGARERFAGMTTCESCSRRRLQPPGPAAARRSADRWQSLEQRSLDVVGVAGDAAARGRSIRLSRRRRRPPRGRDAGCCSSASAPSESMSESWRSRRRSRRRGWCGRRAPSRWTSAPPSSARGAIARLPAGIRAFVGRRDRGTVLPVYDLAARLDLGRTDDGAQWLVVSARGHMWRSWSVASTLCDGIMTARACLAARRRHGRGGSRG